SRAKVDAVVEKFEGSYNRHIPLPYDVRDITSEVHGPAPLFTPDGRPQVILGAYDPTGRRPRAQTSAAAQGGTIGAPPHVHGRTLVSTQTRPVANGFVRRLATKCWATLASVRSNSK